MDILDKAENALKDALLSVPIIKRIVDYFKSIPIHMVSLGDRNSVRLKPLNNEWGFDLCPKSWTAARNVDNSFAGSQLMCVKEIPRPLLPLEHVHF